MSVPSTDAAIQWVRDRLVILGRLYLRWREDAEDALQIAFLNAWRSLPDLDEPERFRPWLFRIARNAALDVARKRRRHPSSLPLPDDLMSQQTSDLNGVSEMPHLLAGLPAETRALVLLRAVEGWSAEDVGAALSWSASTVQRRYALALELLKARSHGRNGHDTRP